ncbi:MAG TPA: glycosyltransferase, partial [Candidatus Saccharimonadales bacterium]|nr:glycosyltransferase [Candidatus Saccharimonadales bacterium]
VGVVDELVLQNFAPEILLGLLASLSAAVALLFLRQALWTFRRFALPKPSLSLKQLPSVSVCVPARNEDHELAECIAAVLRSDYPKLEALVLDDCSQDKTADIIKSFAHDGVRFVQGDEPATGWLGKNQAMNTLAEHASGQWLLFLSADSQLGPGSISQLVHYALAANKQMLSVLPQNLGGPSAATLLGTLQYYWQIVFPITKRRVPVSGKAWFIQAKTLKKLGGFDSVKHKIIPEGSFARRLFAEDAYRFFVSDARLALTTSKNRNAQIRTSIRLLYPTFKRQPMFVLFGLFGLSLLLLPFCVVVLAALWGNWWLLAAGAIALTLLFAGYVLVVRRTQPVAWLASSVCLPLVLAQEMVLCVISMLRYEFSEVSWKGRNVCYPVISGGRRSTPLAEESTH